MQPHDDIIVIGGGPIGACSALALAETGARVTLIEKEPELCPPESGAHANCGLLVPSEVVPLASPGALGQGLRWLVDSSSPFYIAPRPRPALLRWLWMFRTAATPARVRAAGPVLSGLNALSADEHDKLAARPADDGVRGRAWHYHHDGVVRVYEAPGAMEDAAREAEAAKALGVRTELLSETDARARFSGVRADLAGGVFYPHDGHMDPMLFTREMAAMAEEAGAVVRRGTEAVALHTGGPGAVRVTTTRGDFVAGQVVVAAGAWSPSLTRRLGLALPIEPAKGYSVDVPRPAGFPDLPLYLGDAHVVMTPLGDTLRLGSTLELSGWDMHIRGERVARLRRGAERVMGIPSDGPVRQIWRGPRPLTPDGLPVIGRMPGHDAVILATGHCMLGLSLAPATGRLVAELAGGAGPSLDLMPLGAQRFL